MGNGSTFQFILVMLVFLVIYFIFMAILELKKKITEQFNKKHKKDED